MNVQLSNAEISLGTSQFVTLSEAQGVRIECRAGSLWLTQTGDQRDVVLVSGQGFTLDRPGEALIYAATAPATVAIQAFLPNVSASGWKRAKEWIEGAMVRLREPDYAANVFRQPPVVKQALRG